VIHDEDDATAELGDGPVRPQIHGPQHVPVRQPERRLAPKIFDVNQDGVIVATRRPRLEDGRCREALAVVRHKEQDRRYSLDDEEYGTKSHGEVLARDPSKVPTAASPTIARLMAVP
jgi:hypothetical protein